MNALRVFERTEHSDTLGTGALEASNAARSATRRGRPAIITLEIVEQIARLIAKGMTKKQACLRAGVNHDSFRTARHRNPEFET